MELTLNNLRLIPYYKLYITTYKEGDVIVTIITSPSLC